MTTMKLYQITFRYHVPTVHAGYANPMLIKATDWNAAVSKAMSAAELYDDEVQAIELVQG